MQKYYWLSSDYQRDPWHKKAKASRPWPALRPAWFLSPWASADLTPPGSACKGMGWCSQPHWFENGFIVDLACLLFFYGADPVWASGDSAPAVGWGVGALAKLEVGLPILSGLGETAAGGARGGWGGRGGGCLRGHCCNSPGGEGLWLRNPTSLWVPWNNDTLSIKDTIKSVFIF